MRRLPELEILTLGGNPIGDEGLAALVAPPPPAGAPPPTGGLTKLKELNLSYTQVSDAGCAALAAALDNGALAALKKLCLNDIPASAAAIATVYAARDTLKDGDESYTSESESEVGEEKEDDEEDEEDGEGN